MVSTILSFNDRDLSEELIVISGFPSLISNLILSEPDASITASDLQVIFEPDCLSRLLSWKQVIANSAVVVATIVEINIKKAGLTVKDFPPIAYI